MSIQESFVSVHSEAPDTEHVDSPQPGPIHSVAKELSVAPATELPDATEAIVDVSPEPEESSPISLKDNVHELVEDAITKDVPGQVERDASIVTINGEDIHKEEFIHSDANDVVGPNVVMVLDSDIDHDKIGSDDTPVESIITDECSTDVETQTGVLNKPVTEDRDHDRQTEDVGTKTEEPAFEPPKPLHEAKPEPEITTNNHEEVVEPLVNKPLGIVHIHPISTDSTPTEPLATVYPASEHEAPTAVGVETVRLLVDAHPGLEPELAATPAAPALIGVESPITADQDVLQLAEEIVAPVPSEFVEHIAEPKVEQVVLEATEEELDVLAVPKTEPVVVGEAVWQLGFGDVSVEDGGAVDPQDLSTESQVEPSGDKTRMAGDDEGVKNPLIEDREEVVIDGPVGEELSGAEVVCKASTPTERSTVVDSVPTGDLYIEVPSEQLIEQLIAEDVEPSPDTRELQYGQAPPSTEESESLAELSEQRDITVFIESLELVEEKGVNVPILDVQILGEADKNEPHESGEEIFSPLEAEIEVFESVKPPIYDHEFEVAQPESGELLDEDIAVYEPAGGILAEIALPAFDDAASSVPVNIAQKEETGADQTLEPEPAANVEVPTPLLDDTPVVEPVPICDDTLADVPAPVPVVEFEAETTSDTEPDPVAEIFAVKDEVYSEVMKTTDLPLEHLTESESGETLQDAVIDVADASLTSDDPETVGSSATNVGETTSVTPQVGTEKSEEVPFEVSEGVVSEEEALTFVGVEGIESIEQPTLVESKQQDKHAVVEHLSVDDLSALATNIPRDESDRPKSPWTPSYSVNTQGGSPEIEEFEEFHQLPPAPAINASEVVAALESSVSEDSILTEIEASEMSSAVQEEEPQKSHDAILSDDVCDSDVQLSVALDQLNVGPLTEDTPDESPKLPWTPSYSVTMLHGLSPRANLQPELEDVERTLPNAEPLQEEQTDLRASPPASQPDEQQISESHCIIGAVESVDTLHDGVNPSPAVEESFDVSPSNPDVGSTLEVTTDSQALAVAVEDPSGERPKSPWTPSYSVTINGSSLRVDPKPEDTTDIQDLESTEIPHSEANGEHTMAPAEPDELAAIESDASSSSEVKSEQDVQDTQLEVPNDIPQRPWTPSYSSHTQGAGVADDVDEDKDSINSEPMEPRGDTSIDTEESSPEGLAVDESSHPEARDINNQDFPRVEDSVDTLSKPTLKTLHPVDPSSSVLSSRSRYESTASSRFFPGAWFSSPKSSHDEGRPSLDEAAGEFIPSRVAAAPKEPIVEETSEEQKTEEKKSRGCLIM